jgi:hypothetical protein
MQVRDLPLQPMQNQIDEDMQQPWVVLQLVVVGLGSGEARAWGCLERRWRRSSTPTRMRLYVVASRPDPPAQPPCLPHQVPHAATWGWWWSVVQPVTGLRHHYLLPRSLVDCRTHISWIYKKPGKKMEKNMRHYIWGGSHIIRKRKIWVNWKTNSPSLPL